MKIPKELTPEQQEELRERLKDRWKEVYPNAFCCSAIRVRMDGSITKNPCPIKRYRPLDWRKYCGRCKQP